jgi:hypothetical protein
MNLSEHLPASGERMLIARTATALAAASTRGGFVLSSG